MGMNVHDENFPEMARSHHQATFHIKLESIDPVTTEIIKGRIHSLIFNLGDETSVSVSNSITTTLSMDNEPF